MQRLSVILFLSFWASLSGMAQPGTGPVSADDYLKIANNLIFQSSYYNAIEYLENAMELRPDDPNIWFRIADTYKLSRDFEQATKYYKKVLTASDPATFLSFPLIRFEYGDALMRSGSYAQAITQFQGFLDDYRGNKVQYYRQWAEIKLSGCQLAMEPLDLSDSITVVNMGSKVNSPYTNYAPREVGDDYLMYSSLRAEELIESNREKSKSEIYLTQKVNGTWEKPNLFRGPFRSGEEHIGHGTYSQDGLRFYFTRCPQQENKQVRCEVYYSEYSNGVWRAPKSLRIVNESGAKSTTPFVVNMPNGFERLYFSSNRNGGQGGMDIWFVDRDLDGNFGNLTNLGRSVNSPYDEISPFYNPTEQVLFFSSDGYPGMGGFDVFKVYKDQGKWGLVLHLGVPINSALDDTYYYPNASSGTGYLVSNRPGGFGIDHKTCCDNIYEVELLPPPETDFLIPITGVVRNELGRSEIDAKVMLYQLVDGTSVWVDEMMSRNDGSFDFLLLHPNAYEISFFKEGLITKRLLIETLETKPGQAINQDVNLLEAKWSLKGVVHEKNSNGIATLTGFVVSLFDQNGNLLETKVSVKTNQFDFELEPGKEYTLLIEKLGYKPHSFEFGTLNEDSIGPIDHQVNLLPSQ